jgi:16S rRNA (uracil1498-N3)-methyltransferase
MNLVLLFPDDFISERLVRLSGRRRDHLSAVLRAEAGEEIIVGLADGKIGRGRLLRIDDDCAELDVALDTDPPPPLPLALIVALPRPKVLNRVLAAVTSLGVKRIFFINAWRVEKSYWKSPRLSPENMRTQMISGLEQAKDTVFPQVELRRLFRPFVEQELPSLIGGATALAAHPKGSVECPRALGGEVVLSIGPEGGFIDREIVSLEAIGFRSVHLGPRILRVETAIASILGRLF